MQHRGDVGLDTVVKLIITLAVVAVVIGIIMLATDKSNTIVSQLRTLFRFG